MLAIFVASAITQRALFKSYFPKPTGFNGFEDYILAAEVTQSPQFKDDVILTMSWSNESKPLSAGVNHRDSRLDRERKLVHEFEGCLLLIAQGNSKPCFDPRRPWGRETNLQELKPFRQLEFLESAAVNVSLADGDHLTAVKRIKEGLTFATNVGNGPIAIRLGADLMIWMMLQELNRHAQQLSIHDCESLAPFLSKTLADYGDVAQTCVAEEKYCLSAIHDIKSQSDDWKNWTNPQSNILASVTSERNERSVDALRGQSDRQLRETFDRSVENLGTMIVHINAALTGPENEWFASFDNISSSLLSDSPSDTLSRAVWPTFQRVLLVDEVTRTRMRLTILTLGAARQRLIDGKLPGGFDRFSTKAESMDPSGGRFAYLPRDGWFAVKRIGADLLGEVAIDDPVKD